MTDQDWHAANRALWDERVVVHLAPGGYDLGALRAGQGRLDAIVEAELARSPGCACCACNAISARTR